MSLDIERLIWIGAIAPGDIRLSEGRYQFIEMGPEAAEGFQLAVSKCKVIFTFPLFIT